MMKNKEYNFYQDKCPVCDAADIAVLIDIPQVVVHCNQLWQTREQAIQAPRADIRLVYCRVCGHIFNIAFKPELMEYSPGYENSLHFSPHFREYARSLAKSLINRYDLHGKEIIEIGCGDGKFLRLLCELGGNRGIGFDPSNACRESDKNTTDAPVRFIHDFYSKHYANYEADFICCRHVLEHIQFPGEFLNMVRESVGDRFDTVLFFEVPNIEFTVKESGIWDLIYEHCSYFSKTSLSHLFTWCGFEVHKLFDAYDGQFLCIEASPYKITGNYRQNFENDLRNLAAEINTFAAKYRSTVRSWGDKLESMRRAQQQAVVWGGGSKGVTFLNTLKSHSQIEYVVDINPLKQGRYIAGTGQQIVPPEFLRDYQPDIVIVMNPVYRREIQRFLEKLNGRIEIIGA